MKNVLKALTVAIFTVTNREKKLAKLWFFPALIISLTFSACSYKVAPVKGVYSKQPMEISTTKSFEDVWDKLIDLFAQRGFSIKVIDKSSGLITSGSASMPATCEKKDGGLQDPTAFIVVPKYYNDAVQRWLPITKSVAGAYVGKDVLDKADPVEGEWNVRIKRTATGCSVNVNLVNLTYKRYQNNIPYNTPLEGYQSTGVFEKLITDIITK